MDLEGLLLLACTFVIGIAIGSVGVGGVLLGPTLIVIGGVEVHRAMATSLWSFAFTGVAAAVLYARRGSIPWRLSRDLVIGAVPGAVIGVQANGRLPDQVLLALLGVLCVGTGGLSLRGPRQKSGGVPHLRASFSIGLGALVGFGSALTGTGGAVLGVPLLVLLRVPVLPAIGASQLLQLPIALSSTLVHLSSGQVDLPFGVVLGLVQTVGLTLGVHVAHSLSPRRLRWAVTVAVIATGVFILVRAVLPT